jgi:hypothetical protein
MYQALAINQRAFIRQITGPPQQLNDKRRFSGIRFCPAATVLALAM